MPLCKPLPRSVQTIRNEQTPLHGSWDLPMRTIERDKRRLRLMPNLPPGKSQLPRLHCHRLKRPRMTILNSTSGLTSKLT